MNANGWDPEAILATLDKRTVESRSVRRVITAAEQAIAAARSESHQDRDRAVALAQQADQKRLAAEAELERIRERLKLKTERAVTDDTLTITLHHPGKEGYRTRWWLLSELEAALTALRVQGAVDDTQVVIDDEEIEVAIPDLGLLAPVAPPPPPPTTAAKRWPTSAIVASAALGMLMIIAAVILVVMS